MSEVDQTVEINAAAPIQSLSSGVESSSWFLPALVDVEERMKKLVLSGNAEEENAGGDTFAERAEWYYQKRHQLLALLEDLYNGYITLLDRCRKHSRLHSQFTHSASDVESEAESTISYQTKITKAAPAASAQIDELVAELVAKNIENDMLESQVREMDQAWNESARKIGLLKNLMELLESERIILVNENVKLGYKVIAVMEENKGLASEAMFMKRKASELAKCVLRMREDHRVRMLSQKIEDLQEQIYELEKRNKEYYQMLVKKEQQVKQYESSSSSSSNSNSMKERSDKVILESCFLQSDGKINKLKRATRAKKKKKGSSKWWERVKRADFFSCGLHPRCS